MRKQPPFSAVFTTRLEGDRVRLPYPRFRGAGLGEELILPIDQANAVIQLEQRLREIGKIGPDQGIKQRTAGKYYFVVRHLGNVAANHNAMGALAPVGSPLCPSGEEQGGPVKGLSEAALYGGTEVPSSNCAIEDRERSDRGLD